MFRSGKASFMSLHQTCFTGETLVATEDGQKRIDEIEVGDKVWAYDIYTGETELKEVLTVYIKDQNEILHLHTSCGDINTTTNHPFYVIDKGWVAAGDLIVGDEVYLIDGSTAFIKEFELEKLDEPIKVYNLEVDDYHTYFVGNMSILVHNKYDIEDPLSYNKNEKGVTIRSLYPKDHGHPVHLHVYGGGRPTKIGPNGKPVKSCPELSHTQSKAVAALLPEIKYVIKKIQKWIKNT